MATRSLGHLNFFCYILRDKLCSFINFTCSANRISSLRVKKIQLIFFKYMYDFAERRIFPSNKNCRQWSNVTVSYLRLLRQGMAPDWVTVLLSAACVITTYLPDEQMALNGCWLPLNGRCIVACNMPTRTNDNLFRNDTKLWPRWCFQLLKIKSALGVLYRPLSHDAIDTRHSDQHVPGTSWVSLDAEHGHDECGHPNTCMFLA